MIVRGLTLCLLFAALLAAQATSSQFTGTVTDASGAVIPGVTVTAANKGTGLRTEGVTNEAGIYTIPLLQPGQYDLAVRKEGFKTVNRTGVTLNVSQAARIDFQLELGAVEQSIEVTGERVLLESESSTMGQVVGGKQILELPLLGRNPYALAALVPGVRIATSVNDLPIDIVSTVASSVNGQRGNQNEYLLDGAPNTAASQNQPVIFANPDSVAEFKVETNAYSAEYGRAAGGIYNVVTKSGTNQPHGSLYDFLRNDKLNANDFFANRGGRGKAPFRFNQFGGTFGGPVVLPKVYDGRNRTFVFASVELVRFAQGVTFSGTVPKPEELAGDFSNTRNAAGAPVTMYDPQTTRRNPAGTAFLRDPFPGNRIAAARMDPVARAISRYMPAPNAPGSGFTGANNYARTDSSMIQKDTFSVRLDHNVTERNRLFGRFSYDKSPWLRAPAYGADNPASPTSGPQEFTRYNAVVEDSVILSPSFVGVGRVSFSRLANYRGPFSDGFDIATLGFPSNLQAQIGQPRAFPAVNITGNSIGASITNTVFGGFLGCTSILGYFMDQYAAQGNLTKSLTRHTLKFGGEYRIVRANLTETNNAATVFSFGPAFTQGPNPAAASATAGYGLATYLLGLAGGSVTPSPYLALQSTYTGLFVQDAWKVTDKLTVNIGVRYEYESPRTERFNQLTNFDYGAAPPIRAAGLSPVGALAFVGVNGVPRYQYEPDRNNFSPRVGIAYRLTPKTVVRTGAGVFYAAMTGIGHAPSVFGISGFQTSTNLVASVDGVTPLNYLRNPYPEGLNQPSGSRLGGATLLGQDISFFDRGNRVGYSGQWNFNIQRELPFNTLFEVGYVGTRGLKMPSARQWNQLRPEALALGDGLRATGPNPFYPQIATGPLAQPNVSRAQLLRPFPQFTAVTAQNSNYSPSTYHALQAKVEKRYARGFTVMGSYTWSKLMDINTGFFNGEDFAGGGFQDLWNLASEWAVSTIDQTHRLMINGVYELPFFPGQKGFTGRTLGGWEAGVIFSAYSGAPLGVGSAVNTTFAQGGGQRPDWNGVSPSVANPSPDRWLDATRFSNPAPYRFGTAPRTFGGTRADGQAQIDLSLHKNTRIRERLTLQFRAEFFNLTNTPRFAVPNTNFGNPLFGTVSGMGNQPRVVQLALKLLW